MSQIIKSGSMYTIADVDQVKSTLPVGTYNLIFVPMAGFRLIQVEDFKLPNKIYGDLSIIDRSIKVYRNRDRNFGLLLAGLRGSGKSLLMKKLALDLHQPIIIVNQSFADQSDELIKFLTSPCLGDCTILFDEFEKRFDREDPTPLVLMDGPYNTHHFFILTVNNTHINENLINRPGRIYYHKTYVGLNDDLVKEVGEDLLVNKDFLDELVDACSDIRNLSFDMLISLINDVNLFNESPKECLKVFGFDQSDGCFAEVYQILSTGAIKITDSPIWMSPTEQYLWLDDVIYHLNDGTEREAYIRVDLTNMQKVSKSKYKLLYQLNARNARIDDEDKDNFTPQTLEFEINLNVQNKIQYVF